MWIKSRFKKLASKYPDLFKVISNTAWLSSEKIIRRVVGLLVSILVARYLGPDLLGKLSFSQSFVSLFYAFISLGLGGIIVRDLVAKPEKAGKTLGSAFTLKFLGGVFVWCTVTVLIYLMRPESDVIRLLVIILAVGNIFSSFDVIDHWFTSEINSKYSVIGKNIAYLICRRDSC
jgi:O-antigen/teichoic acid export membrane protein